MKPSPHSLERKAFQLERIMLFSDAVFAIAVTLLVIEIKVPKIDFVELTESKLLEALAHQVPAFIGYVVSFFFIGQYWVIHHRMFGYVVSYTQPLLWLNLFFLFAVALMPFSTAFFSEYFVKAMLSPTLFYAGNLMLLGTANLLTWSYIYRHHAALTQGLTPAMAHYIRNRAAVVLGAYVLFVPVFIMHATAGYVFILLLAPAVRLLFRKKAKLAAAGKL
jgi:uncharacterized membrane protein